MNNRKAIVAQSRAVSSTVIELTYCCLFSVVLSHG